MMNAERRTEDKGICNYSAAERRLKVARSTDVAASSLKEAKQKAAQQMSQTKGGSSSTTK